MRQTYVSTNAKKTQTKEVHIETSTLETSHDFSINYLLIEMWLDWAQYCLEDVNFWIISLWL